jgi:hypothetical protein
MTASFSVYAAPSGMRWVTEHVYHRPSRGPYRLSQRWDGCYPRNVPGDDTEYLER